MSESAIILIPIVVAFRIVTNGVQGGQAGDTTTLTLDVPKFRNLLPRCAGLRVYGLIEGVATNIITFNLAFFSGLNRDNEIPGGPFNIAAAGLSAAGSSRSAENNTDTNWHLDSRLVLTYGNYNGVTGVNSARISAVLAARLAT